MASLEHLLIKLSNSECTPEELEYLLHHFSMDSSKELLKSDLEKYLAQPKNSDLDVDTDIQNVLENVLYKINGQKSHRIKIYKYLVAASILICVTIGLWFYKNKSNSTQNSANQANIQTDIKPGSEKATLTLANGKKIILDQYATNKEIASEAGIRISKNSDNKLIYNGEKKSGKIEKKSLFNELKTPVGGQYSLLLSDGTKVWLNASSTLKFPAAFAGKERIVELNGEAYFEVAKNSKMPFRVLVNKNSIEVLGTHFNVMAYEDEINMNTTLLEGSVKVANTINSLIIKPNEQASISKTNNNILIKKVDAAEAIAWKNGYFLFDDENIESIMKKLSRWYNVEVEYKGTIPKEALWGNVSRTKNISEVLKTLELTNIVHFKLEGRRVIVIH